MNYYFLTAGLVFIALAVLHESFRPNNFGRGKDGTPVLGITAAILIITAIVSIWV